MHINDTPKLAHCLRQSICASIYNLPVTVANAENKVDNIYCSYILYTSDNNLSDIKFSAS